MMETDKKQVLIIMNVDPTYSTNDIRKKIDESFASYGKVNQVHETIFTEKDVVSLDDISIGMDVEGRYGEDYDRETLVEIAKTASTSDAYDYGICDAIEEAIHRLNL